MNLFILTRIILSELIRNQHPVETHTRQIIFIHTSYFMYRYRIFFFFLFLFLFFFLQKYISKRRDYTRARFPANVFLRFPLQIQTTRPYNSPAPIMAGRAFTHVSRYVCSLSLSRLPTFIIVRI